MIGLPARSTIEPPRKGAIPNNLRPSNPFSLSHEPDWMVATKNPQHQAAINQKPKIRTLDSGQNLKLPLHHISSQGSPIKAHPRKVKVPVSEDTQKTIPILAPPVSSFKATRKPGPPIPRKPPLLSSLGDLQKDLGQAPQSTRNLATTESGRSRLSKSQRPMVDLHKTPPSALQYPKPLLLSNSQDEQANISISPSPPAAPFPLQAGLMDEEDDCARTIPSLKPLHQNR